MTRYVARNRRTLLLAAAWTAVGVPAAFFHGNPPLQAQAAAPVPAIQSPTETDWQIAAGGKMAFDVASVRQSQPGTFTPPNFP